MFPSKHLSKQYLFKTWPCPSWDGLWAFVGFGLLGLRLYLLQRLTRKTLNVFVDKPWSEWTETDSKKAKFDWIAKNIITSSISCD